MIFKRKKIAIGLIIIASILGYSITLLRNKPQIDQHLVKEKSFIAYPSKYNYRQTKNDCGPYNVAAIIRALKYPDVDSALLTQAIGWRLPNDYTLPWGLENQLKAHSIRIEKPNFNLLNDVEKITLVREYLSSGKPTIILGERDGYEHYMTLLGFDANRDEYYVYDSLQKASPEEQGMTTDENYTWPGNKTMNSQDLLNFWRGGGMYGLWKWYGLVAST